MHRPPPPQLRSMRWWDIPAVLELEDELFGEDPWSAELFWSELAAEDRYYLVAEEAGAGGRIVGYAGLRAAAPSADADVQTIGVRRALWGTGLGARLLEALLDEAARRGCDRVLLEVRVDNARAQGLYRRYGFAPVGIRRGYYPKSGTDALVMRLTGVRERAGAHG